LFLIFYLKKKPKSNKNSWAMENWQKKKKKTNSKDGTRPKLGSIFEKK